MSKRIQYLDFIKVIACFFVIMHHSSGYLLPDGYTSLQLFVSIPIILIYRTAIPLFLMVSGALLLGKEYEVGAFYKKRILRVLVPLLFIIGLSYFSNNGFNFKGFIIALLSGNYLFHLWYIYLLIGIYLMTPFLSKFVKNLSEKEFRVFFFISIIFLGIFPIFEEYFHLSLSSDFAIPFFSMLVVYYMLGYYLNNKKISKKMNTICIISFFISIIVSTIVSKYTFTDINHIILGNISYISIIIPTVCIFLILKYYFDNRKLLPFITTISNCTFGIYLIHYLFLERLSFIYNSIPIYLLNVFLLDFAVFIICFIIIYVLKKIPFIKDYL